MAAQTPELKALLDACDRPRTMDQLRAVLNDMNLEQRVYNAVQRGLLRNTRKGSPHGAPGLFERVDPPAVQAPAEPARPPRPHRVNDRGHALQQVWGGW
jgi:hypothetical protein